uniref:Uncharacterized protein n=1 Tax=Schlesneria paludicola TaxID=360056 RepID=A0A7C2JZ14_9PLAN
MPIRRNPDTGKQAVTWLATAFVFLVGAIATALTLLSMAERAGWQDWTVWAGLFGGAVLMLWALSGSGEKGPANARFFWVRVRSRTDPLTVYKPKRRRSSDGRPLGSNQPPTLESVREAAESSVQWVPHSQPERERPPRSKKS